MNRRFNTMISMIIVLASVFFVFCALLSLVSCGEPTFISLPNLDESITKITTDTETMLSFSVQSVDPDLSMITNGPGLILTYIILDEGDLDQSTISNTIESGSIYSIRSNFASAVSHGTLSIDTYNRILQTTINGTTFELKSFKIGLDTRASSPTFHLNLDKNRPFNITYVLELENNNTKDCGFRLIGSDGSVNSYSLADEYAVNDRKYVMVFASMTSGFGTFNSAPVFSQLTYVGRILVRF